MGNLHERRASSSAQSRGAGEPAQHASAHMLLCRGEVLRCKRCGLGEVDRPLFARGEHPIDHAAVEVDMLIPLILLSVTDSLTGRDESVRSACNTPHTPCT